MRRGLAISPEGRRIFPNLTVRENLVLGAYYSPERRLRRDLEIVYQLFPRLEERLQQRAGTLSGGRAANARSGPGPDVPSQDASPG